MLPASVLRQLYVQGSLKNTPEGVEFKLRNMLAPATIIDAEVAIDGNKVPKEKMEVVAASGRYDAAKLAQQGYKFTVRDEITIILKGLSLPGGPHRIDIKARTREWGDLAFDVTDVPR
ncbi:MAG: hydroxymethylglutaryl-CoA reductase [Thermoproteus sp.]|nr:hydroxymethylglutaryl-CoA reductase [Thermoproteus sp.]